MKPEIRDLRTFAFEIRASRWFLHVVKNQKQNECQARKEIFRVVETINES